MITGEEYLARVDDDRAVWYAGEKIDSILNHPVLGRCVRNRAEEYDLHFGEHSDELCFQDKRGESACIQYQMPKEQEDIQRHRTGLETALGQSGGYVSDHLHYSWESAGGLMAYANALIQGPAGDDFPDEYVKNIEEYYQYCCDNDISIAPAFAELDHDSDSLDEAPIMRAEETNDGLIVNGIRTISTAAAYVDDLWVTTSPEIYREPGLDLTEAIEENPEYFFAFSLPVDTDGLKVICRPSEVSLEDDQFDYPVSYYDEVDGIVSFEDVLVPWDRVLCYDSPAFFEHYSKTPPTTIYSHNISMINRLELMLGTLRSLTEKRGNWNVSAVQTQVVDNLVVPLESIKALLRRAETESEPLDADSEFIVPSEIDVNLALLKGMQVHSQAQQIVRKLAGGMITVSHSLADLHSSEVGDQVEEVYEKPGGNGKDILRETKLIEDITSSIFSARRDHFLSFSLGPPHVKKFNASQLYDFESLVEKSEEFLNHAEARDLSLEHNRPESGD